MAFSAATSHVLHLNEILLAAHAISSNGTITLAPEGITISTEYNHILSFKASIDISLFSTYNLNLESQNRTDSSSDRISFGIDLSLVANAFEALNQKNITCYLSYDGEGAAFIVEFEDNLISESIEFLTFYLDIDTDLEMQVNYEGLDYELILKSDLFTNLLQDLQQINTKELYIYLSTFLSHELSFISNGPIGHSKLIYPNEKTILEKFEIFGSRKAVSCFRFSIFIRVLKAVRISNKCKIVKDSDGVLSLQLICKDTESINYCGSLITINMLELDERVDTNELESFFDEIPAAKRRRVEEDQETVDEVPLFL